jgi:hypothetical protein
MLPRRCLCLIAAVSALALANCGSSSTVGPVGTRADGEIYDGPVAVAIAPVVDGRPSAYPEVSRAWLQTRMARILDRDDLYAGVIPLGMHGEAHEGEILLQPALTALTWAHPNQRSGSIAMRIRATHVPTGRVRLDQVYNASCRDCKVQPGQPAVAGPFDLLMQDVVKDLRRRASR